MFRKSLSRRLVALWLMLFVSAITTGVLMTAFFRQSTTAQVDRAEDAVRRACLDIADRYAFFSASARGDALANPDDQLRSGLVSVVERALMRANGVEGGVWSQAAGSLAYAFPTYEGTGPKTDLPVAETPAISDLNARVEQSGRPESVRRRNESQVLVLHACPLSEASVSATAWTMTRVFTGAGAAYERLLIGLGVLAATVVGSALWLAFILLNWSRRVRALEQELAASHGEAPSKLSFTGERELDRLIEAVNVANQRSAEAQRAAAADQRLASLGLLAAGVAHEIRNPIAAMRLKSENALASGDRTREKAALQTNLDQIGRLDRILRDLLTVTEAPKPTIEAVNLPAFCAGIVGNFQDLAQASQVALDWRVDDSARASAPPRFDEEQVRRAIGNLVANAIQHTPAQGRVDLLAQRTGEQLRILVKDTGPGVPEPSAQRVFEPFVTGRPDGAGLGLAIVRETARAHGGEARLVASECGACFEIEIPWNSRPS